ncbi:GNAT family N-acetyltransferase [Thalassotalea euphylliae]|uniref:N-acetyltransferase n=1 Tax=Thalassotalea euphylliae TaxID=1655234 RepID=A0A3E0U182_9GAMM|nr:GNAT family N-acetyltransferase [Thalassotalea euphylliae]REL30494.1 N-acetyltransferase [Thalassotalea euphylliae]
MKITPSERLFYRLLKADDAQLLADLDQDPEVMKYINGGRVNTLDDIEQVFMPRLQKFVNPSQGWGMWGVFTQGVEAQQTTDVTQAASQAEHDREHFIGWVLIRPMGFFTDKPNWDELEIGWRFKRNTWGKGYATESAQHVMSAIKSLGIARGIGAIALPDNSASIGVMKKLGLQYASTYQHTDPLGDAEVVYYRLAW